MLLFSAVYDFVVPEFLYLLNILFFLPVTNEASTVHKLYSGEIDSIRVIYYIILYHLIMNETN